MSVSMWLIGAGTMAQAYAQVLKALNIAFHVVGRGEASANVFQKATRVAVQLGGVEQALANTEPPKTAIVAVGVEQLAATARALISAGCKRILLEKPGGLELAEIKALERHASAFEAEVLVAYNRRFYASTAAAETCIHEDGGLTSVQFEFTEWAHKISPLTKGAGVKAHWLLANSSHVIDLAFHFAGLPADWRSWHQGKLDWHPAAARFCGAGVTRKEVLFSYLADWQAPGRWGIELLTRKRRLILRPMEQLSIIPLGQVTAAPFQLDDRLDQAFKPGLYKQTQAFLEGDRRRFCSLADHVVSAQCYAEMAGYL